MRSIATIALTAAVLAGAGLAPSTASARTGWGSHPRRTEVNGRLFNQQQRIRQGVRSGELTSTEAHTLRSEDRGIYHEEKTMAKLDNGHITKADQRALNQQETAVSKQIYTDKHN